MKQTLLALVVLFSASAAEAKTTQLSPALTRGLIEFLAGQENFGGGIHQGSVSFGANIECGNAKGEIDDLAALQCFVRPIAGFSMHSSSPVRLSPFLEANLATVLSEAGAMYVVSNGVFALGGDLSCEENSMVGETPESVPSACSLSSN